MRNRVHGLLRTPRPIILELVSLSEIIIRCIPARLMNGRRVEAWFMSVKQPGDELPTFVHVWDSRDRN